MAEPGSFEPGALEKLATILKDPPSSGRVKAARVVAILADLVQLGFFPIFWEGAASPVNDILDVAVAIAMVLLVGWHWAFLPSILAKLLPGLDLVPTWTAAVLFATREKGGTHVAPPSSSP